MLDRVTIERAEAISEGAPFAIALSGGGDSTALLHLLAQRWGAARLCAVVVDHALRPGSAADARAALAAAQALGARGEIVTLAWARAGRRAQAEAREARYAALCAAALSMAARVVFLGHTRDDQAETVFMRAARASGWRGLAGMRAIAPMPLWPQGRGLSLARPLLGARRSVLRDLLRARAVGWIEDPANENPDHARVRVRRRLAELERAGFDPMRLARLAERLAAHAQGVDSQAAALIARSARFDDGAVAIGRAAWRDAPQEVRVRALSAVLTAAGGAPREPDSAQVAGLEARAMARAFKGETLSGAWVRPASGGVVVERDPGALSGRADGAAPLAPLELEPGRSVVWDRRLALTASEPGWRVVCDGAPVLRCAEARRPLAAASPQWLLKERVQHVLGPD